MKRAWLAVALYVSGCISGAASPSPKDARPRVEAPALLPPSRFVHDVQWRQRVTAHWPSGRQRFDAVLQKRAGELMLVGLSPLGLPGFVLRLREDRSIDVENRSGRDLPFQPSYVLADVQRVFFPWLPEGPAVSERSGLVAGVQVREQFAAGRLTRRSFERVTAEGTERVQVDYSGWREGQDAPDSATLTNDLLRYKLTIETIEQSRLR